VGVGQLEKCPHHAPLACAVPVIRWDAETLSDKLRQCSACGHKGAALQHPGWGGADIGFLPFPTERTESLQWMEALASALNVSAWLGEGPYRSSIIVSNQYCVFWLSVQRTFSPSTANTVIIEPPGYLLNTSSPRLNASTVAIFLTPSTVGMLTFCTEALTRSITRRSPPIAKTGLKLIRGVSLKRLQNANQATEGRTCRRTRGLLQLVVARYIELSTKGEQ
jgi:hypothetical protein